MWSAAIQLDLGSFNLKVELQGHKRFCALIGPNGSGKSTLLRTIAGGYQPQTASIKVNDHVVVDTQAGIALPPHMRLVGFLPQHPELFSHLDVLDNTAFGLLAKSPRLSRAQRRKVAADLCRELLFDSELQSKTNKLSGGQRQKVALARTLLAEPQFVMLDEPCAYLDTNAKRLLRRLFKEEKPLFSVPLLMATHDPHDVIALDPHIFVLEKGRIIQEGSCEKLRGNPASAFVEEFFSTDMSTL
jgi:molybdate transport system ATP-binding protein